MPKKYDPSHGPISAKYKEQMIAVARTLDKVFNGDLTGDARTTGFVLLVFEINDKPADSGRFNYLSNGIDRRDMIKLFREQARRMEELNGGPIT